MSMKLKRSLLLGTVLVICLAIWTIALQSMTGSKLLSKSTSKESNQEQISLGNKVSSQPVISNSTQEGSSQVRGVATTQVDKSKSSKSNQPEVSMNLDHDQVIRLTKGDK